MDISNIITILTSLKSSINDINEIEIYPFITKMDETHGTYGLKKDITKLLNFTNIKKYKLYRHRNMEKHIYDDSTIIFRKDQLFSYIFDKSILIINKIKKLDENSFPNLNKYHIESNVTCYTLDFNPVILKVIQYNNDKQYNDIIINILPQSINNNIISNKLNEILTILTKLS